MPSKKTSHQPLLWNMEGLTVPDEAKPNPLVIDRSRLPKTTQGAPVRFVLLNQWEYSEEQKIVKHEVEEGSFRTDFFGLVETYDECASYFMGIPLPFSLPRTDTPLAKKITDFLMGTVAFIALCLLTGLVGGR